MWGIPNTSLWHPIPDSIRGTFAIPGSWHDQGRDLPRCVACSHGDNSSQHWARFCIVPVLVATTLYSPTHAVRSVDQLARTNTTGCVIASHVLHQFRRLLLEHGGMQHSASSVPLSVSEWLTRLHDNCLQSIPARFLTEPSSMIRPMHTGSDNHAHPCLMRTTNNEAVTLHSVAFPDLICTATAAIAPEQTIAALPLGHPWLSLISPAGAHSVGLRPNSRMAPFCTGSPNSLCAVIALQPIGPDEMILACPTDGTQAQASIQVVGQFDGSCHRSELLGGAGYVIYVIEGGQSRVMACRAVALPKCSDNIEAEILACLFLVEEVSDLVRRITTDKGISPKVVIQGDILPVIKYFQFAGRLRRLDMNQPLERIRTTVSLHLPHALFLYLPRVANSIADNLAGQASEFILARHRCDPMCFNRDSGPVSIRPVFPTPLLQVGGFHIQCCSIEIGYSPRAPDHLGRKYCCTVSGQRMPRAARLLLFGQNHCEVDLKGSFYELVRRLGLHYAPDHMPLPAIDDLRTMLSHDPYIQAVEAIRPNTIKLKVINSTTEATLHYLQSIVNGSPGAATSAVLHQLWLQAKALTDQLLPHFRPDFRTSQVDSTFRLLEYFEARIVEDTIKELIARHPTQSIVWLHDGFLVAPAPAEHMLRQIEEKVLSQHKLFSSQTWFRINTLTAQYAEYVGSLRGTASAPALAIARRGLPQRAHKQHTAIGLAQTCITPLEALAKLRTRPQPKPPRFIDPSDHIPAEI